MALKCKSSSSPHQFTSGVGEDGIWCLSGKIYGRRPRFCVWGRILEIDCQDCPFCVHVSPYLFFRLCVCYIYLSTLSYLCSSLLAPAPPLVLLVHDPSHPSHTAFFFTQNPQILKSWGSGYENGKSSSHKVYRRKILKSSNPRGQNSRLRKRRTPFSIDFESSKPRMWTAVC